MALLFSLAYLQSCQQSSGRVKEYAVNAIVVKDFRGKTVRLEQPARRIVCLIESALSGIYMLGANKNVVGISTNVYTDKVFEQYSVLDKRIKDKKIPAPGNWDFVNIEKVISLKPDLIIIWADQAESVKQLEARGIPVYGVMLKSIDDIYKEIRDLGILTGTSVRADSLISYSKKQLKMISETFEQKENVRKVYFAWAQGLTETSGTESTVNELIKLAGAQNACQLPNEHLTVNIEKIFDWNPDVIILWYNERINPSDLQNMSGWNQLKAVKNKQVYELPSVFFCDLWTLKFQFAVKLLHYWCYPESAVSFDYNKEQDNILQYLYNKKQIVFNENIQ